MQSYLLKTELPLKKEPWNHQETEKIHNLFKESNVEKTAIKLSNSWLFFF